MTPDMDLNELRDTLDEYSLVFASGDWDELELIQPGIQPIGSWRLTEIVDGLIEVMASPGERDDMLALADHFSGLAKRIRRVVADIEGS